MIVGNGKCVLLVTGGGQIWIIRRASGGSPAPRLQNPALSSAAGDCEVSHLGYAEMQLLGSQLSAEGFGLPCGTAKARRPSPAMWETQAGQLPLFRGVDAPHRSLQNKGRDYVGDRR